MSSGFKFFIVVPVLFLIIQCCKTNNPSNKQVEDSQASIAFKNKLITLDSQLSVLLKAYNATSAVILLMNPQDESLYYAYNLKKAYTNLYSPGSIFKIITLIGLLRADPMIHSVHFSCRSVYSLFSNAATENLLTIDAERFNPGDYIRCSHLYGHGEVDIKSAFIHSCNLFFIKYGSNYLHFRDLKEIADRFHLFSRTGYDFKDKSGRSFLLEEKVGKFSKAKTKIQELLSYIGDNRHTYITPIEAAKFINILADELLYKNQNQFFSSEERQLLLTLMEQVVKQGTAKDNLANKLGMIAGKTGTGTIDYRLYDTNGWFIGFIPEGDVPLSWVIFVEESTSKTAAKLLYELLNLLF